MAPNLSYGNKTASRGPLGSQRCVRPAKHGQPSSGPLPLRVVVGYIRAENPDEVEIARLRAALAAFCLGQGFQLGGVFCDRGIGGDDLARDGFAGALAALQVPGGYALLVPSREHLSTVEHVEENVDAHGQSNRLPRSGLAGRGCSLAWCPNGGVVIEPKLVGTTTFTAGDGCRVRCYRNRDGDVDLFVGEHPRTYEFTFDVKTFGKVIAQGAAVLSAIDQSDREGADSPAEQADQTNRPT